MDGWWMVQAKTLSLGGLGRVSVGPSSTGLLFWTPANGVRPGRYGSTSSGLNPRIGGSLTGIMKNRTRDPHSDWLMSATLVEPQSLLLLQSSGRSAQGPRVQVPVSGLAAGEVAGRSTAEVLLSKVPNALSMRKVQL